MKAAVHDPPHARAAAGCLRPPGRPEGSQLGAAGRRGRPPDPHGRPLVSVTGGGLLQGCLGWRPLHINPALLTPAPPRSRPLLRRRLVATVPDRSLPSALEVGLVDPGRRHTGGRPPVQHQQGGRPDKAQGNTMCSLKTTEFNPHARPPPPPPSVASQELPGDTRASSGPYWVRACPLAAGQHQQRMRGGGTLRGKLLTQKAP